ncbi:MAG: YggS family pyridoxal phosphate-dependent enzyme [Clostridia bacterium]|nr:YggS family pyridoxal phosphate-dependent enzyme [Clostridia bacterium]
MMEKSLDEYRAQRCHDIEENLKEIRNNIAEAAIKSGRNPEDVKLMAVTKTVDPYFINHALAQGIDLIGENRVQEYLSKKPDLNLEGVDVHLIGHLQTNKVKQIVGEVSTIQSVDSIKVAKEISKQSVSRNINTDILLEINIGNEDSKSGMEYDAVPDTMLEIAELPGLKIRGLMAIPPIEDDEIVLRSFFSKMNQLFVDMKGKNSDNISIDILSMGMSADYVPAILEGSNLVRVGSSLFGARIY